MVEGIHLSDVSVCKCIFGNLTCFVFEPYDDYVMLLAYRLSMEQALFVWEQALLLTFAEPKS